MSRILSALAVVFFSTTAFSNGSEPIDLDRVIEHSQTFQSNLAHFRDHLIDDAGNPPFPSDAEKIAIVISVAEEAEHFYEILISRRPDSRQISQDFEILDKEMKEMTDQFDQEFFFFETKDAYAEVKRSFSTLKKWCERQHENAGLIREANAIEEKADRLFSIFRSAVGDPDSNERPIYNEAQNIAEAASTLVEESSRVPLRREGQFAEAFNKIKVSRAKILRAFDTWKPTSRSKKRAKETLKDELPDFDNLFDKFSRELNRSTAFNTEIIADNVQKLDVAIREVRREGNKYSPYSEVRRARYDFVEATYSMSNAIEKIRKELGEENVKAEDLCDEMQELNAAYSTAEFLFNKCDFGTEVEDNWNMIYSMMSNLQSAIDGASSGSLGSPASPPSGQHPQAPRGRDGQGDGKVMSPSFPVAVPPTRR